MSETQTELETINLSVTDGVATIELNRPQALNAWTTQFGHDLLASVRHAAENEAVRSVLITGADLKEIGSEQTAEGRPDVYKQLTEVYHPIMAEIRALGKPVVAGVNGP